MKLFVPQSRIDVHKYFVQSFSNSLWSSTL